MHLPVARFASSRSVSVGLDLPHLPPVVHLSLLISLTSISSSARFYLYCPLTHSQRSLLLNSGFRQLTFMRLDIPVQPHSYVQ